jgi:hypothetical protein
VSAFVEYPTAVHALAEAHDTANSVVVDAPVGFGVGWIVHAWPSHTSANVTSGPPPDATEDPTATQLFLEVHDTAASALFGAPVGFDVCWIVHAWPSQISANVPPKVVPGVVERPPTAMQSRFEVQVTAES